LYFYEYSGNQNTEALYLGKYHERGDLGVTTRRDWLKAISLALGVVLAGTAFAPAQAAEKVTVFAAASLKNALDAINGEWLKQTGKEAIVSYAASSALAKQIEQGAPADVFISADLAWMDYLADKKLIKADTRSNLLGNRIVLVSGK
jgi:molybdate transport system substrate-binding protein